MHTEREIVPFQGNDIDLGFHCMIMAVLTPQIQLTHGAEMRSSPICRDLFNETQLVWPALLTS